MTSLARTAVVARTDRRGKSNLSVDHTLAVGAGRLRIKADDDQAIVRPRLEAPLAERDPGQREDRRTQLRAVVIGEDDAGGPSADGVAERCRTPVETGRSSVEWEPRIGRRFDAGVGQLLGGQAGAAGIAHEHG